MTPKFDRARSFTAYAQRRARTTRSRTRLASAAAKQMPAALHVATRDEAKNAANQATNGVSFEEVSRLSTSGVEYLEVLADAHSIAEHRFICIGFIGACSSGPGSVSSGPGSISSGPGSAGILPARKLRGLSLPYARAQLVARFDRALIEHPHADP